MDIYDILTSTASGRLTMEKLTRGATMTDELEQRLAAIEQRANAATEGPWFDTSYGEIQSSPKSDALARLEKEHEAAGEPWTEDGNYPEPWASREKECDPAICGINKYKYMGHGGRWVRDFDFISHARTDIPWLIAKVRELQADNMRMWKALEEINESAHNVARVVRIARAALAAPRAPEQQEPPTERVIEERWALIRPDGKIAKDPFGPCIYANEDTAERKRSNINSGNYKEVLKSCGALRIAKIKVVELVAAAASLAMGRGKKGKEKHMNEEKSEPRAYTAEEARNMFLDHMRAYVKYWENESRAPTVREKLDGLAFCILNIIDGTSGEHPGCDIVVQPHPDDKEFHRSQSENWYEPGTVINDVLLHEMWYPKKS